MFWSCAETYEYRDILNEAKNTPKEINFSDEILTNTITKGVIENDSHLHEIKLGIFAKINTVNGNSGASSDNITYDDSQHNFLIYNDQLSFTIGTGWAATKTFFWPKTLHNIQATDPTVNFYAYGPYEIGTTSEENGIITITGISSIGKGAEAKDFVYGSKLNQTYDLDNSVVKTNKGYVDFTMAHQMAWISFEAKKTTDFEILTLTKIDVKADNTTAEFKINTTKDIVSEIPAYSAKLVNASEPISYVYEFTPNETVTNIYKRVADLIALPQNVSNNMTATITYTAKIGGVTYTDRVAVLNLNGGGLTEDGRHVAPWQISTWNASNKYTYRINFEWEEIKFTASVTQWTETGNYYRIY